MKTSKSIREERASVIAGMNDITVKVAAEQRSMTSEEKQEFDNRDAAQAKLLEEAETIERSEKAAALAQPEQRSEAKYSTYQGCTKSEINKAFKALLSSGNPSAEIRQEFRNAADKAGINLNSLNFNLQLPEEVRALGDTPQTVTTSAGGYTIQNAAMQQIEKALLYYAGVREHANIIRTNGDGDIPIPTNDDTGNVGELIGINTSVTNQAVTFGTKSLKNYKFSSKLVLVPTELIEDSSTDIVSYVSELLGERIGRCLNTYYTTGTGSSQPQGVVTGVSQSVETASGTAIDWKELIVDLPHTVDIAYRNQGCAFMLHDLTLAKVKKMVDDNLRPLWLPGLVAGAPDTLGGYPIIINNDMTQVPAVAAASKHVALFGNFRKFSIRDTRNIQVQILRERFAEYDQVALMAWYRGDSIVVQPKAFAKLTMKAT